MVRRGAEDTGQRRCTTLIAAGHTRLVVDLTSLAFLDSTGLHALVEAWDRARDHHGMVRVVCPDPLALRAIRMTGLDTLIAVYDTVAEALMPPEGG